MKKPALRTKRNAGRGKDIRANTRWMYVVRTNSEKNGISKCLHEIEISEKHS